jgi:hypothetical protein
MSYQLDDPQSEWEMAWGPGVEPGFSDSESDVLPIRRSPKNKSPGRSTYRGSSRRQTTACLHLCEGGLHGLLLDMHHAAKIIFCGTPRKLQAIRRRVSWWQVLPAIDAVQLSRDFYFSNTSRRCGCDSLTNLRYGLWMRGQLVDESTIIAIDRPTGFCWWRRFLSVVSRISKPSRSAAASNCPFVRVCQPRSKAVSTWLLPNRLRSGTGVP